MQKIASQRHPCKFAKRRYLCHATDHAESFDCLSLCPGIGIAQMYLLHILCESRPCNRLYPDVMRQGPESDCRHLLAQACSREHKRFFLSTSASALVAELHCSRVLTAMAGGSILDGLRFQNFVSVDEDISAFGGGTEGKFGIPRFSGDPARLNEWTFRIRTKVKKEATLPEDEKKKLGPLGLRLLEGSPGMHFALLRAWTWRSWRAIWAPST